MTINDVIEALERKPFGIVQYNPNQRENWVRVKLEEYNPTKKAVVTFSPHPQTAEPNPIFFEVLGADFNEKGQLTTWGWGVSPEN
jgi:hypothetical protein